MGSNGFVVAASHSRIWRAVLEGVSSSSPDGSATRITDTCAMIVAAAAFTGNASGIEIQAAAAREHLARRRSGKLKCGQARRQIDRGAHPG